MTLYISAGFGLASHLGVLADIPCIGVGKKLYHVDGLQKDAEHKRKVSHTYQPCDRTMIFVIKHLISSH